MAPTEYTGLMYRHLIGGGSFLLVAPTDYIDLLYCLAAAATREGARLIYRAELSDYKLRKGAQS